MYANCYRHSGKLPLTGMVMTLLIGAAAAACLGVIYSCGVVYIGFIYVNFLFAMLFGMGVSAAVTKAAKLGHVRSQIYPAGAAFFASLVGLYFAWAADLVTRVKFPLANGGALLALNPNVLASYIRYFYEHGLWTINFHHGANNPNGPPISGIALAIIWVVEAGMIVGLATVFAWKSMADLVYCEPCEKWVKQKKDVRRLRLGLLPADLARIGDGDLTPLSTIPRASKNEPNFIRLDLGHCDGCAESNFLTINRAMTVVNKKGKKTLQVTVLLRALAISPEQVVAVKDAGVDLPPPSFQTPPPPPATDAADAATADGAAAVVADSADAKAGGPPVKYPWE